MSDWRKAAGVLRGAIPPGETPESMIRRLRDGGEPTEAERALAVLDRLWARYPNGELRLWLDGEFVVSFDSGRESWGKFTGCPTPAAALLALGAKLAEGDDGE